MKCEEIYKSWQRCLGQLKVHFNTIIVLKYIWNIGDVCVKYMY